MSCLLHQMYWSLCLLVLFWLVCMLPTCIYTWQDWTASVISTTSCCLMTSPIEYLYLNLFIFNRENNPRTCFCCIISRRTGNMLPRIQQTRASPIPWMFLYQVNTLLSYSKLLESSLKINFSIERTQSLPKHTRAEWTRYPSCKKCHGPRQKKYGIHTPCLCRGSKVHEK